MSSIASETHRWQQVLYPCGLLAPLIQLGTDGLAGSLLRGYTFASQSISELSAAGSPTRSLVVGLTLVAGALMMAFGVGVWRGVDQAVQPRVVVAFVIGNALTGAVAAAFFPTQFGERPSFGRVGVVVMFLSVCFSVLAMLLGAVAFSGWLRILSAAIPASFILLAILRFATATTASAATAPSSIGAQERTMAYSYLLWVMALAIYLLLSLRDAQPAGAVSG